MILGVLLLAATYLPGCMPLTLEPLYDRQSEVVELDRRNNRVIFMWRLNQAMGGIDNDALTTHRDLFYAFYLALNNALANGETDQFERFVKLANQQLKHMEDLLGIIVLKKPEPAEIY